MTSPVTGMIHRVDSESKLEPALFAIPKKGRLHTHVMKMIEGAGLDHTRVARLDLAPCTRLPVTLVFLPAADIAKYVAEGDVDMGITGEDIIAESQADVKVLMPLGIGKCRLCVQAPVGTVKDVKQLAGKRIVTSFPELARKFFAKYDEELGTTTSIKYVSGSVEVACSLGLADAVVDLVETGTTMRAAGLEVVATVMQTSTVLISNHKTKHQELVDKLYKRIEGYIVAQAHVMITYNIPRDKIPEAEKITPGHESVTIQPLEDKNWAALSALVVKKEVSDIMDRLQEVGAKSILTFEIANARY
eukprot:m.38341 g.38341  ORF g.38341 m.38341 type:complete len:304 (+) comp16468_c0_seq1:34-945(+)